MAGNLDRNGFASGERGGWYGEPDWENPWNRTRELLPVNARCETCRHWCGHHHQRGQCLSPEVGGPVKRAEDRCGAWQVARAHEVIVARAEGSWKPTEPWLPVFDGVNR